MLMNHLWFGKNLKDSIAAPILFVDSETAVYFEPNFDKVNLKKKTPQGNFKEQSDIQAPEIKKTKHKGQKGQ